MTTCTATNCMEQVQKGHLMCRKHWLMIPSALRNAIHATWRTRQTSSYQDNVLAAVELIEREEGTYSDVFPLGRNQGRETGTTPSQSPNYFYVLPYLGTAS